MGNKLHAPPRRAVDREALVKRRTRAIALYIKGKTRYQIAKRLRVSFQAVSKWVEAYELEGMEGLKSLGKPGPKSKPSVGDVQLISTFQQAPPSSRGIVSRIKKAFGNHYSI